MDQLSPHLDVQVEWAPYFLRSGIPEQGVEKPGGPGIHQVNPRLRQVGEQAGINFTGLCPRFPNTTKAHALLTFAKETGGAKKQNDLQEVLFRQYFTDGKYPDVGNLADAAAEVGLSAEAAREALESGRYEEQVKREAAQASRSGVTGVPFFVVNGKPLFSGAQPPEAFVEALLAAGRQR